MLSRGGMISCQSIKSCRTERSSAKKDAGNSAEEMEQVRNEIAEREARFQELGRRVKKLSLAGEDLDEEIRVLQTGEVEIQYLLIQKFTNKQL